MADSDDEYDRKRRDKFRGERSAGGGAAGGGGGADSYRSDRRDDRRGGGGGGGLGGRDEWPERNPFRGGGRPRPDYRDYRGGGGGGGGPRDRYGSPGREMPPAKRMRPDWGDEMRGNPRFGGYDQYLMHAWNDHYASHGMHPGYGAHHGGHSREPPLAASAILSGDTQTQPAMMTLKQFLDTQDDGISDSEVLRKYTEYKLDFKRQQLNEFFVAHKDEEWFKNKYHPLDSVKRKDEQLNFLRKRVDVFKELLDDGQIKNVSIDTSQTDPLLRLLDTVVIKLEGGTEEDLKILDEKPKEISAYPERLAEKRSSQDDDVIITSVEKKKPADDTDDEPKIVTPPRTSMRATVGSDMENWDDDDDTAAEAAAKKAQQLLKEPAALSPAAAKKKEKKSLKRKRTNTDDTSSSSSSDSDSSSSSSSEDEDDDKVKSKYDLESVEDTGDKEKEASADTKPAESLELEEKPEKEENGVGDADAEHKIKAEDEAEQQLSNDDVIKHEKDGEDDDAAEKKPNDEEEELETSTKSAEDQDNDSGATDENATKTESEKLQHKEHENDDDDEEEDVEKTKDQPETETIDLDKEKDVTKPRALHRTSSIFLRNLAPSITKAEIEAVCQKFDGYLRVAIADPLVERRWYRRGWVTFKRDVNIKEICWNLNNTRLRDCEMGAIVNRDLSRRVRPVNGLTAHKTVVRSDIKLCAKIAMNLDERFKLWEERRNDDADSANADGKTNGSEPMETSTTTTTTTTYGFKSNNPVLQNITDFLIEEASAEEEELLGISGGASENKEADADGIERDPQLLNVLDCLVLYLRIVHSVDFYNHCEYPYEDEMPNRCGIIHARGPPPSKVSANDMQDYIKNFESKMQQFLTKSSAIEEDDLKNLGCKDAEAEVEKFVQANTQELAKDKWLCPLSGKKFKGPEFIRKHIFNKHAEKVDEVRKEVEFFNNYLKDPKRPQLPEHPGNTKRNNSESSSGGLSGVGGYRPPMYPAAYPPPYATYAPPMMMPGRGGRGFGGGGGGGRRPNNEYRQLIQYRDLDAPQEPVDMFN